MLRLALLDWQRAHGRVPQSLNELVPEYFAELPLDPVSAGEFCYFPDGIDAGIVYGKDEGGDDRIIVPQGIPFLVTTHGTFSPRHHRGRDGHWKFTDYSGQPKSLKGALLTARKWLIEPSRSSDE